MFELELQDRQRRFEFVGYVRGKGLLALRRAVQPFQKIVDGRRERNSLGRQSLQRNAEAAVLTARGIDPLGRQFEGS